MVINNFKRSASDIPRGLATGLASGYNEKNMLCIEIPCALAGESLQCLAVATLEGHIMEMRLSFLNSCLPIICPKDLCFSFLFSL